MSKATATAKPRVPASVAAARKALVIVSHPKGDYAPEIAESFCTGLDAYDAAIDRLRALAVNGELTKTLQGVCEQSLMLGSVMKQLLKRARDAAIKAGKETPVFQADKLLGEALRIRNLEGFKDNDTSDNRRTKGEQLIWTAAATDKSRALSRLKLSSVSTRGGKRDGAGAKRKEAAKVATPEEKAVAQTMVDAANGDLTLVKPAVGEDFKLRVPAKTPKDAAHYLYNLEKGLRMTIDANPTGFKDELVADVVANILKQIDRLHNKLD